MTTVEMIDGVLPVVVEESTAGERLTMARLQLQGRRALERRPATPEELEQHRRRTHHEWMNAAAAAEGFQVQRHRHAVRSVTVQTPEQNEEN